MIRTREFVIFLSVVTVLLVAIFSVLLPDGNDVSKVTAELDKSYVPEPEDMSATVVSSADKILNSESYAERRNQLREKVLAYQAKDEDWSEYFVLFAEEDIDLPSKEEDAEKLSERGPVRLCEDYQAVSNSWPQQVSILEQEGARLLYDNDRASSDTLDPRAVLAQLPLNSLPKNDSYCLPYDVVGIALDGRVIKNADVGMVNSNTEAPTKVGYAFDGLPIYSSTSEQTVDECGGAMVEGQYGYIVDSNTSIVLSCFSSRPVSL